MARHESRTDRNEKAERFARTGFSDERGAWYALDNAGIIMPAVSDDVATSLYRMEAILKEEVRRDVLDAALAAMAVRFRYFNVVLRRGFFWYYLEPAPNLPVSEDDPRWPSQSWNVNVPGTRLFRIRVRGRTIAAEISHAMADGAGGISFLKSLVVKYFRRLGVDPGAPLGTGDYADIHSPDSPPDATEYEDGYRRHFASHLPPATVEPRAWHLRTPLLPKGQYRVIGATVPLRDALALAKARGVTLTELCAAVYMDCLQDLWLADPRARKPHLISLEIPVNMRKFFPTRSNRNFSLFVLVTQDMRLGRRDFDEILSRTHHQLRIAHDARSISTQITRNVAGATSLAVRLVPLGIKDFFARILFRVYGDNTLSGFISNLGRIDLPPGVSPHVETWTLIPAPSKVTGTNASMLSWGNDLRIHFGGLAVRPELERLYFTKLRRLGLPVKMERRPMED